MRIWCGKCLHKFELRFHRTTPGSVCSLNALAIDEPLEYVKLYLDGTMQIWVDADDTLSL